MKLLFRTVESATGVVSFNTLLADARAFAEIQGDRLVSVNVVSERLIIVWYWAAAVPVVDQIGDSVHAGDCDGDHAACACDANRLDHAARY